MFQYLIHSRIKGKAILFLFYCFSLTNVISQSYNPSLHTPSNKPYAPAQGVPTDARSYFYDSTNFSYRAFRSVSEATTYINTVKSRTGHTSVIINTGGSFNAGVPGFGAFTGGTYDRYWFKDGIGSGNLVLENSFTQSVADARYALLSHTQTFSTITALPTTLSGYGITDAAIAASVSNVDNTSDATKNSATATLANKTLKTPKYSIQTLTDATTTVMDMSIASSATWTIAGDRTLSVTNPVVNSEEQITLIQDGTGSRHVTWPASFKWQGGTPPTLTATAGGVDIITCTYTGTIHICNYGLDYR